MSADFTPGSLFQSAFGRAQPAVAGELGADLRLFSGLETCELAKDPEGAAIFDALPSDHRRLLSASNGLDRLDGCYRLFGLGNRALLDLAVWNRPETWKFAWQGRADPYLVFGQSALGNQFAYRRAELGSGATPPVYELYAVTLDPVETFSGLESFFLATFLEPPDTAYHRRIEEDRRRRGAFGRDELLVYLPSPLLVGGRVDAQELERMDARQAMILQGDLAVQLDHRDSLEDLDHLEPWTDVEGRERLRVVWRETD